MSEQRKKSGLSVRAVVATGIGAAVFFILMKYIAIPTGVPNTNVNVAEGWLALIAGLFVPVVGFLVGIIGHTLTDATYGAPWWSWVLIAPIGDILIYKQPANKVFLQGIVAAIVNILSVAIIGSILIVAYVKSRPKKSSLRSE